MWLERNWPEIKSDFSPVPVRNAAKALQHLAGLVEGMDGILSRELVRLDDPAHDLLKRGLFWRNSLALFVIAQSEDLERRLARTRAGMVVFSLSLADAETLRFSMARLFEELRSQIKGLRFDGTGHYPLALQDCQDDLLRYAEDSRSALRDLVAESGNVLPSLTLRTRIERPIGRYRWTVHEGGSR